MGQYQFNIYVNWFPEGWEDEDWKIWNNPWKSFKFDENYKATDSRISTNSKKVKAHTKTRQNHFKTHHNQIAEKNDNHLNCRYTNSFKRVLFELELLPNAALWIKLTHSEETTFQNWRGRKILKLYSQWQYMKVPLSLYP